MDYLDKKNEWPNTVCYPKLFRAQYARYDMRLSHRTMLTDRHAEPLDNDEVVQVHMKAVSHGNAVAHEEDGYGPEFVEDMTGMLFGLLLKVTGMDDCTLGALMRDVANELIPEGC